MEGKTCRDRIQNTGIRKSLLVPSIKELAQENQLQSGYLIWMEDEQYPQKTYEARLEKKRPRHREE